MADVGRELHLPPQAAGHSHDSGPGRRAALARGRPVAERHGLEGGEEVRHLGDGVHPRVGPPKVGLAAAGLDLDENVTAVGDGDSHAPAPVRLGPAGRLADDDGIGGQPALVEQEYRAVGTVLLLVYRVDAFQRSPERDASGHDGLDRQQGAGEIATRVRCAAPIQPVVVPRGPERVSARHGPGAPITGRIGIEMVVQDQRRAVPGAAQRSDDVWAAFALGHQVDLKPHGPQLLRHNHGRALLPPRWFVRIKRVFSLGLSSRDERAGEVEPTPLVDAVQHLSFDRRDRSAALSPHSRSSRSEPRCYMRPRVLGGAPLSVCPHRSRPCRSRPVRLARAPPLRRWSGPEAEDPAGLNGHRRR